MLGMRTNYGISAEEYHKVYRSDFVAMEKVLREMEKRGWVKYVNEHWRFTPTGFLLSNTLINTLLDAQAEHKLCGNPWVRDQVNQSKK